MIINILYMDAPDSGTSKYIKQILTNMKEEIDSNKIIVEDAISHFNNKQVIQRENIGQGNIGLDPQLWPNKPNRIFHPTAAEYTFFSSAYEILSI